MTLQPMLLNRDSLALDEAASAGQDRHCQPERNEIQKSTLKFVPRDYRSRGIPPRGCSVFLYLGHVHRLACDANC